MIISNAAIKNRTTVLVLTVLIIVAGLAAYFTLPREAAPDVPVPLVMVSTVYEGVAPQDVETAVTMKIEQKLTGLKGVKEVTSTSREGMSLIVIEFLPDIVIDDAMQYVRDKVDQAKPDLPEEAEDPTLAEINIAEFPIMLVSISGPISPVRLKVVADELEDAIESQPGILDVEVLGALEREIRLEFDPARLAAYEISIPELVSRIPSENVNVSAGGLEAGTTKFNIRMQGEFREPGDIDHLLLTVRDGKPIYLQDVAEIRDTFKDRDTFSRLDGKPSITLSIKKRVGSNILEVAQRVQAILDQARLRVPLGVDLAITMDRSTDVNRMVADLENNILTGMVLVVVVLMLFMGLRTALIVSLAIPLSMLMSFAILQALGITLNMVVLFSLVLAVGMLVDNAIVIVENIYRYMQLGHGRIQAAMKGTAEVAWPVITSTLTTVAAFMPMLFWPGIVGEFMKYLPIGVIIVLSCSLFVALVINPTVASMFAKIRGQTRQRHEKHTIQLAYRHLLEKALRHPVMTLGGSVLTLVLVAVLYGAFNPGVRFFPDIDPKRAIVNIRLPQGTSVHYTDQLTRLAEQRIEKCRFRMEHVVANVGSAGETRGFGEDSSGPHVGTITLVFPDFEQRKGWKSADIVDAIRKDLADIPGAEIKVGEEQGGPPTGAAVTVRIAGEDFQKLAELSEQAKNMIVGVPNLVNLRSDYEATRPELQFVVDRRRAMLLGLNTQIVGNFLKTSVFGSKVSTYREFNDEYDITVRLPEDERRGLDDLFRLTVPDRDGNPIPLSSLGEFVYRGGFGDINRVDQKRVITLTADVEGRQPPQVLADVMKILTPEQAPKPGWLASLFGKPETPGPGLILPTGYTLMYAGEKEEQDKASAFLGRAFVIGCLVIVLILVMQFNTLSVPVIIMSTVVLSLAGVGVGLLATHTPFVVIMTGIGVVSLAGVVVNNAIVLLDYTRQLQREGMEVKEAAAEAGMTRLRPVFLTAITTILGLLPMATGISFDFHTFTLSTLSESSEWWRSMANAVIFGLGFATLLTLVVVPTMYTTIYRGLRRFGLGGLKQDEPAAAEPVSVPTPDQVTAG